MGIRQRISRRLGARFGGAITRVTTTEAVVALTFDDGPDPVYTPRLLDVLAAGGAKATFFLVGEAASRHPELTARIHAEGHAIGNHSWSHPSFPLISSRRCQWQVERCAQVLPPQEVKLFRPPFGQQSWRSHFDLWRLGYQIIAWDSHCEDWRQHDAEALYELLEARIKPGSIVLMHDALYKTLSPECRDRGPLLAALEGLLRARRDSTQFLTVPELLQRGRPLRKKWIRPPADSLLPLYGEEPASALPLSSR
jgi:peptidoglycan/xylan/chitin deacetylase (PgdA/CDA1 family)